MALIDHILEAYREASDPRSLVLGTVVDLQGSGYRRPGARMLIREDGSHVGAISGGCLEKDAARHARAWIEEGPQTVLFDTRSSQFRPLGAYGTGCEGVVHLFLQSLPRRGAQLAPLDTIQRLRSTGKEGVLVTAYESEDALASQLGTVGLISNRDASWAQDFPEPLRERVTEAASACLSDRKTRGLRSRDDGLRMRMLLEYLRPPVDLVVVGTGRDAEALVQVARGMNWRIRVVGADPMKLQRTRFPGAETLALDAPGTDDLELTHHSYVVQMTHNFELDRRLLPRLLESPAAYIGLLGPRRRTARLLSTLHREDSLPGGATAVDDALERLSAPIGLDLGGEDPYEVAIAIIAEIVAAKNERTGGSLSEREGSIHDEHEVIATSEVTE